jgi:hypothetical protein
MTTSEATAAARRLVSELARADDATKRLATVMADEVDRLSDVVSRIERNRR